MVSTSLYSSVLNPLNTSSAASANFGVRRILRASSEELVLAPFERRIDVAKDAQEPLGLVLGKLPRQRAKRPVIGDLGEQQLGRALAHGWASRKMSLRAEASAKCTRLKSTTT